MSRSPSGIGHAGPTKRTTDSIGYVTGSDPNDANVQVNPQYQKEWAPRLVSP